MIAVRLTRAGREARVSDGDWHRTLRRQGNSWPCPCLEATEGRECAHQIAAAAAVERQARLVEEYRQWTRERRT